MKHLFALVLLGGSCFLIACNKGSDNLDGIWKAVLPADKWAIIHEAYKENEAEVLNIKEVSPGLYAQYGTRDLDSLKSIMLEELKQQYEPANNYSYKFTKDGFLILHNDKNQADDTLFTYTIDGGEITFTLIDENKAFSESVFEEGSSLSILKNGADSLIMTMTAGTFEDTIYMVKQKR